MSAPYGYPNTRFHETSRWISFVFSCDKQLLNYPLIVVVLVVLVLVIHFHQSRKLVDGFHSFLNIFLYIHRNNCMQSAVSLQAWFFCIFPSFVWNIEIFTSEYTLCVSQHSFLWNQLMDLVHFLIYSCLYIVVSVCKASFRYKHYFLIFSKFCLDLEIFSSECTPCVCQHSFSWNQLMDFVRFWIYSCLYIVVTVCQAPLRYKHYFLHFPTFPWDLEIFTSECTSCVSKHSFSWNHLLDFVHFWI